MCQVKVTILVLVLLDSGSLRLWEPLSFSRAQKHPLQWLKSQSNMMVMAVAKGARTTPYSAVFTDGKFISMQSPGETIPVTHSQQNRFGHEEERLP